MKRLMQRIRHAVASPTGAALLLLLLLPLRAAAQNYCNNPIPPCDPNDPGSPCYKPPEPPPKCEPIVCDKCTKSPCFVGSGVFINDAQDLEITTTGFPIAITRHYMSTHTIDGESGYGWTSSLSTRLYYAVYLKSAPSTFSREADVRLPSGAVYRFVENADGSYTPPDGRFDTLVRNNDSTWDLWLQQSRSHYHFSATGNLLTMVDDFGNTQTWTYASDRLQQVADTSGSGRYVNVTYGADGRISDVTDHTGRNVHYTYDSRGVMTAAGNPASQSTTYSYVNGKYVPLLSAVTDPWGRNVTTIAYDAQDRTHSYTDSGETFTYTYNYNGVATTTTKSDSSGNLWQFPFGSGGLVSDSRPPDGATAEHDDYYASGLIQTHTDPMGVKTYYTYNTRGNPVTVTFNYQGANAVEWRIVYDTNFPDQPVSIKPYDPATNQIHPHWQGSKVDYFPPGSTAPGAMQAVYTLDSDGVTARLSDTFTYDAQGRLLTLTNANGSVWSYTYDSFGNLQTAQSPANNDAGTSPVTTLAHDALGRTTSITDPEGAVTTYAWDVLDRPTSVTRPQPSPSSSLTFTTTYVHDEYDSATQLLFTRVVDPNGRASRYGYDAFHQAIQMIDPAGNISRNIYVKGLLSSHFDPNGYLTAYAWDSRRRLSTVTFPDGTFERLTYNADDTVASKRDRAGQTITYQWDAFKRPLKRTYPSGATVTYTQQGQKLVQVVDTFASPAETHTLTWDSSFQVIAEAEGPRGTINYTYGPDRRAATVSVSTGGVSTYGYYPDGSVRSITWNRVSGAFGYAYTLAGRVSSLSFPNGQTRAYTYDQQGRTTQVTNQSASGVLAAYSYGYDIDPSTGLATLLGLRTSVTATLPSASLTNAVTNFGYDSRDQLTRADYPAAAPYSGLAASWTYDAAGHRTTATANGATGSYVYNKFASNPLNSPQLQSDGGNSYTYDAKGNVLSRTGSRGNLTLTWDENDRLKTLGGSVTASYLYDYSGRRAAKTVGGATAAYLYDGTAAVAESGASPAEFLYGPGLDEPLAMARGGQVYYYAVDGTNSVVALTDTAAAVQNSYVWDAWGNALLRNETVANPFGYTARNSGESDLDDYRFRTYEPATGRFLSEDPLRQSAPIFGSELYSYVRNSPVMNGDPFGLRCWTFSSSGPWTVEKTVEKIGPWELAAMHEEPYIPWPGRQLLPGIIPIFVPKYKLMPPGTQFFCYWNKWVDVTSYLRRRVTLTAICDCPPMVWSQSYDETKIEHSRHKAGATRTESYAMPCEFNPPK